jgi:DNA mismatch endonuclease (patch repair protein)
MPDHMTKEQRSRAMKAVALKHGPLERRVQRELRSMGVKYRCHPPALPGRPDIVLPTARVAIFIDGRFWHGWRLPQWEHKLSAFWRDKLRANRARDQRNFRQLRRLEWRVVRIWEHQIKDEVRLRKILQSIFR